jgi:hypothetical protein
MAAATIDVGLLQDATQMKLDILSAMYLIAETWRSITPTVIEDCLLKCGFSIDHVSSTDNSAVKLTEDEVDDWQS